MSLGPITLASGLTLMALQGELIQKRFTYFRIDVHGIIPI
jgi:hypothetical protein